MIEHRPSAPRLRLTSIFEQVFSNETLIAPKQYLTANAIAGVVLALWGAALALEARSGGAALLVAGIAIVALVVSSAAREAWAATALCIQGAVLAVLGVGLAADTMRWAATAPPHATFRYVPGVIAIAITYGMLQIAAFGGSAKRAPTLRIAGLVSGAVLELIALGFVLARALR